MSILVREADLKADRNSIIEFLHQHLTPESDRQRFEWLYLLNPAGPAVAEVATDSSSGETVGFAAAFPRKVHLGSKLIIGWVLGDFCIAPAYRSAGPALLIQRRLIGRIGQIRASFYYDFPSKGMMAIYRRLGVREFGRMIRFVLHLRAEPIIQHLLPASVFSRSISKLLDPYISRKAPAANPTIDYALLDGPFSEEFLDMDQDIDTPNEVRLSRDPEYLNWRFRGQPQHKHLVFTVRKKGRLGGYVIVSPGETATIQDLIFLDADLGLGLLEYALFFLQKSEQTRTVNFPLLPESVLAGIAIRAGFRPRESCPVIMSPSSTFSMPATFLNTDAWTLTSGDRDS